MEVRTTLVIEHVNENTITCSYVVLPSSIIGCGQTHDRIPWHHKNLIAAEWRNRYARIFQVQIKELDDNGLILEESRMYLHEKGRLTACDTALHRPINFSSLWTDCKSLKACNLGIIEKQMPADVTRCFIYQVEKRLEWGITQSCISSNNHVESARIYRIFKVHNIMGIVVCPIDRLYVVSVATGVY